MKKRNRWMCLLLTLLIIITCPGAVYGEENGEEADDKTLSPYFVVEGGDKDTQADRFPLKETKVTTSINGVIAETYVSQAYANEGNDPINASYVFPASTRVAVHGMKMEIGDKVITAKIKEKEEAKEVFEEAKSEGKSASLLEQQRPNVFHINVANIMPGDTVRIELHYTELISPTDGVYQFVFPTVVGPRYASPSAEQNEDTDQWVASPYLKDGATPPGTYDINVNLSTGVPITGLTCKSHDIDVAWDGDSAAQVTLANKEDFAGNRDFILDYKLTGPEVSCGLMLNMADEAKEHADGAVDAAGTVDGATAGNENFFMLMVQPPERYETEDIPAREYIFVLDVSGSMDGYPLDTAKELITDLVANLRDTDRFNLILFSDTSVRMSPESVSATEDNVKRATYLIDRQMGGGGTELAPALESAVTLPMEKDMSRSIVVITDGYMSDEDSIFDIIDKNLGNTSFFSFGIGTSVNRYLIDGMAKLGSGEAFVVTDPSESADTADRFRTYIESPILTDIQVTYEGFETYDIEPPAQSTLFAQRPIVLFGKFKGQPGGTIRITGKTGSKDYVQEIPVDQVKRSEANQAIPYLWARTRVERLTDYNTDTENQDEVKKEVTEIGLNYSMMTPYTSFVAVMDTVRNEDGQSTDVDQPLPLPANVSNLAVGGYTIGSEPEDILLLAMALSILSAGLLLRRRKSRSDRSEV